MIRKLTHQELLDIRMTEEAAAAEAGRTPVIAILENIRSLYNVGSIFRTADGARLTAVYTVGYTPHPPRPEIDKTALGATKTVPSQHFATSAEAIEACKSLGMKIAALEITSHSRSAFSLTPSDFPLAIVLGNEITGVSEEALELCDFSIEIPMLGSKHSLNVAVATGIALFECVRVLQKV